MSGNPGAMPEIEGEQLKDDDDISLFDRVAHPEVRRQKAVFYRGDRLQTDRFSSSIGEIDFGLIDFPVLSVRSTSDR